jgi:hypothetical protein
VAVARRSGEATLRSPAAFRSPPTVALSSRPGWSAIWGAPSARRLRSYLERDGVTRDGEKDRVFGAAKDRTDAMAFAGRGLNDRHHFRFVVTPRMPPR